MPLVEQYVTIACVSNEVGGDLVGNALWRGVALRDLLDRAGVQDGCHAGRRPLGRRLDGRASRPPGWTTRARGSGGGGHERRAAAAEHGYPARLIVPGLYGYVSATKWLTRIELTTLEAFNGYWVPLGWAKEAPILTQARIDVPSAAPRSNAGQQPVAGVAWAPDRGVSAVEVQVDDGPWAPAELSAPDLGRDLGAVALPLGRAARRPHAPRPRHRRHRRGADRDGHRARARRGARLPHHHRQVG